MSGINEADCSQSCCTANALECYATQVSAGPRERRGGGRLAWLKRPFIDGALFAAAAGGLSLAVHALRGSGPTGTWFDVIAAFTAIFSLALLLEILEIFRPGKFQALRHLRPSTQDRPLRTFLLWYTQVISLGALTSLAVEIVWNLYLLGQNDRHPTFQPGRIEITFWAGVAGGTGWRVLTLSSPYAAAVFRQASDWRSLSTWVGKQKWVTFAAFGLLVTVYLADFFKESQNQLIQHINNRVIQFTFIGYDFNAVHIFTLECLGFILGMLASLLFNLSAPILFRNEGRLDARDAVRRSIRQCGYDIAGPHFSRTLKFYRDLLSQKVEWLNYNWAAVDMRIAASESETLPPSRIREGSLTVALFPPDEELLRDLGETFFVAVRPIRRFLICAMLVAAEILTALPVLVKTLLLFFPKLAKDPSSW